MKRFLCLLICFILSCSFVTFPAMAAERTKQEDATIILSQSIDFISEDCYFIETIYIPIAQTYSSTKTGTKTATYVASGSPIFSISVTGQFSYDGSSAEATSAEGSISAHVDGLTVNSRSAYTSGASAIATGSVNYNGVTLKKTVTLTCDKNGNLS